jgi:hypothetical protein
MIPRRTRTLVSPRLSARGRQQPGKTLSNAWNMSPDSQTAGRCVGPMSAAGIQQGHDSAERSPALDTGDSSRGDFDCVERDVCGGVHRWRMLRQVGAVALLASALLAAGRGALAIPRAQSHRQRVRKRVKHV